MKLIRNGKIPWCIWFGKEDILNLILLLGRRRRRRERLLSMRPINRSREEQGKYILVNLMRETDEGRHFSMSKYHFDDLVHQIFPTSSTTIFSPSTKARRAMFPSPWQQSIQPIKMYEKSKQRLRPFPTGAGNCQRQHILMTFLGQSWLDRSSGASPTNGICHWVNEATKFQD